MLKLKDGDVVRFKNDDEFFVALEVDKKTETLLVDAGDDYKYEYQFSDVSEVYRKVKN